MVYTSREDRSLNAFSAGQRDQRMTIREYGWLTPEAYVAMWQFAAGQDLVYRIHLNDAPSDDPILHFARDPRTLRVDVGDGILVRIVDLPRALMTRNYQVESELTFRVIDDLCDWNQGTWKLSTGPEGADIRQVDEAPQLTMDVFTMAHLATGALSATYAHRLGRIEASDKSCANQGGPPLRDRVRHALHEPLLALARLQLQVPSGNVVVNDAQYRRSFGWN